MNRTFDDKRYESNCRIVKVKENDESALDLIGELIGSIDMHYAAVIFKVVLSILCFVGFVGVIGGVEAGHLSVGTGIIISMLMLFFEILCFVPRRDNKSDK